MVDVPRAHVMRFEMPSPSWQLIGNKDEAPDSWTWSIVMRCPNGHEASLDDHEVFENGVVSPSVVCPEEDCRFHDLVRLLDWSGLSPTVSV